MSVIVTQQHTMDKGIEVFQTIIRNNSSEEICFAISQYQNTSCIERVLKPGMFQRFNNTPTDSPIIHYIRWNKNQRTIFYKVKQLPDDVPKCCVIF